MKDFYSYCSRLDSLKQLATVDEATTANVTFLLKDKRLFRYFFYKLESTAWLDSQLFRKYLCKCLSAKDRLRSIVVAEYLRHVAINKPRHVAEIVYSSFPKDRYAVRYLLETVNLLPSALAAKLASAMLSRINALKLGEGELFGKLVLKLAKAEEYSAALLIAKELTRPVPKHLSKEYEKKFPSLEKTEAVSTLEAYEFEEFLGAILRPLSQTTPDRLAKILVGNLVLCFKIEKRRKRNDFEDYSWIWRPSIGADTYLSGDIKNRLASALRDVMSQMAKSDDVRPLNRLLARFCTAKYSILRRLALHTIGVAPDKLSDHLNGFVKKRSNLHDYRIEDDLLLLLKENFGKLDAEAKSAILEWIDVGPDIPRYVKWRSQHDKHKPSDQDILDYANTWKLQRLWKLREHLPERRKQVEVLSRRYSVPKEREVGEIATISYGYSSPFSVDELLKMDDETLLAYVCKPEKGNDPTSPHVGFALRFGEAVKKHPARFLQLAERFADPVIMPLFLQHYMRGLHEAWKAENFIWPPDLMKFAEFIVKGFEQILTYPRSAYSQPKKELADFIGSVVQDRNRAVTPEQLQAYRQLLIQIASDEDPPFDPKKQTGDWSFISLNSTSGTGLHTLIKYALRYAHERKGEKPRLEEEVKSKLMEILQFDERPSNRAVLGMYLANLWYLDDVWVKANLRSFFPPENNLLRQVVWDAYVSFNNVYTEIIDNIRAEYLKALKELRFPRKHRDSRDKLAQHIAIIYWRGLDEIDPESSLVRQFFETASIEYRRTFIWQIERGLQELRDKDQLKADGKEWQRPRALWSWRTSSIPRSRTTKKGLDESSAFLQWLPYVPEDITSLYPLIEATLLRSMPTSHVPDVTKYLTTQSEKFPVESAKLLRVYFRIPLDRHYYYSDDKDVKLVLERALEAGGEGRAIASDIANKLGEYGRFDYKYVWERANAAKEPAPG